MKKFFALVLALVMALSLTTVAWGAAELPAAVDGVITLTEDVTLSDTYKVDAGTSVTIDLNGKTLSYTSTVAAASCAIENKGTLTIKDSAGGGKLTYVGVGDPTFGYGTNTITNCGKLTIDGGTIINTTDSGSSNAIDNAPSAELIVNSGVIKSEKVTIRLRDNSTATINGGEISGARAVQIHLFQNVDAETKLTINGGTLTGSELALYSYAYGNCTFDDTTINIAGGTFEGDVAFGGGNKTAQENVTVTGGTFNSGFYTYNDTIDDEITISGGTFSVAPDEDYLADGLAAVLVNGEYVLQEPADVSVNKSSSNVDTEDWVAVDLTTGTAYDIAEDAEVKKIVYKDIKKTVNGVTTTQYGVTLYGPLTFEGAGAAANDGYAMVVAKESANMQLETAAGKIIFARFITADEYAVYSTNEAQYAYTTLVATDYEEKAANPSKCEDVIVSYYVVGDDYYAAATSNADNTLVRYKNEFVIVGEKLDGEPLVPHVFLTDAGTTCKWTVTNNKITSVKCTCGDTFKIVQDIKGLKAGSYVKIAKTLAGETNFAIVSATTSGITSSGSSSSTDKTVTSAETFDAGIAMYVGMSVMAAAGSAVVIGKKKD